MDRRAPRGDMFARIHGAPDVESSASELCPRLHGHGGPRDRQTRWHTRRAVDVFAEGGRRAEPPVDVKILHAKIGALALENDLLGHALGNAGLGTASSAKR